MKHIIYIQSMREVPNEFCSWAFLLSSYHYELREYWKNALMYQITQVTNFVWISQGCEFLCLLFLYNLHKNPSQPKPDSNFNFYLTKKCILPLFTMFRFCWDKRSMWLFDHGFFKDILYCVIAKTISCKLQLLYLLEKKTPSHLRIMLLLSSVDKIKSHFGCYDSKMAIFWWSMLQSGYDSVLVNWCLWLFRI